MPNVALLRARAVLLRAPLVAAVVSSLLNNRLRPLRKISSSRLRRFHSMQYRFR